MATNKQAAAYCKEISRLTKENAVVWAMLNGLGLRMYTEDETVKMVYDRVEKVETENEALKAERDKLLDACKTVMQRFPQVTDIGVYPDYGVIMEVADAIAYTNRDNEK